MSVNGDESRTEVRRYVNDGGDTINETIMKHENLVDIAIRKKVLECVRLDPLYLNQEQLEYELAIRAPLEAVDGPLAGNDKRHGPGLRLKKMLREDERVNRKITEWTKKFSTMDDWRAELEHCQVAIGDLSREIIHVRDAWWSSPTEWETFEQIGTLLTHYYGRWSRLNVMLEPDEHNPTVAQLLGELEEITVLLGKMYAMQVLADRASHHDSTSSSHTTETDEVLSSTQKPTETVQAGNMTEAVLDISDWPERVEHLNGRMQHIIGSDRNPKQKAEDLDMLMQDIIAFYQTVDTSKDKFSPQVRNQALMIGLGLKGLKSDAVEHKLRFLRHIEQETNSRSASRDQVIEKTREWKKTFEHLVEQRSNRLLSSEIGASQKTLEIGRALSEMETEMLSCLDRDLDRDLRDVVEQWLHKCRQWICDERLRKEREVHQNTERTSPHERYKSFNGTVTDDREHDANKQPVLNEDPTLADLCKTMEEREAERLKRRVHMQPQTKVVDKSVESLNGSKLWPRTRVNEGPVPVSYHPCTPYHEPEYDDISPDSNVKKADMSAHHKQQYLKYVMGSRRFDGEQKGDPKSPTIDEYIESLKRYKAAVGATDAEVLQQQYLYMTGRAHNWWLTQELEVRTINELEVRLRARFGAVFISPMQRLAQFTQRKQSENEHLLDYMDDKRALARKLDQPLPEQTIIEEVVNNAQWKYRSHLAARSYESLNALNRQMEYLCQGDNVKPPIRSNRPMPKQFYGYKSNRAVNATEMETTVPDDEETANDDDELKNEEMLVMVDLVQKYLKRRSQQAAMPPAKRKPPSTEVEANAGSEKEIDALTSFRCYGCNAPGVMRRDCTVCQAKDNVPKNGQASQ